jgi:hypothetical protein
MGSQEGCELQPELGCVHDSAPGAVAMAAVSGEPTSSVLHDQDSSRGIRSGRCGRATLRARCTAVVLIDRVKYLPDKRFRGFGRTRASMPDVKQSHPYRVFNTVDTADWVVWRRDAAMLSLPSCATAITHFRQ